MFQEGIGHFLNATKKFWPNGINPRRHNEFKEEKLCPWRQHETPRCQSSGSRVRLQCLSVRMSHEKHEVLVMQQGEGGGSGKRQSIQDTTADVCSTSAAEDGVKASQSSSFFFFPSLWYE